MSKVEDFLTHDQEQQVVAAIRSAEKTTSGEIRVHLEKHTEIEILERATEVFHWLKMDNTIQRNGVLIYVAVEDRSFAIFGDKGINDVVEDDFWESTKDTILEQFKKGDFTQGLINGVLLAGEQLQKYFPWDHTDINELSDEISKG
ncbi:putative membrane protein [Aquimarina sp. EL_43]|uniref:TPM domain-containing protein n=1 Tax=Aquimarina TaxID=290174 RepID=UPI00046E9A00|nr:MULTISPECIES: TPM domain-containing protein [Aquimarina]MBG6130118.1 putative membrane protein [Aquimarina sp. EL_35]MBG6148898.1 putative membrane protein [Aquimarina sp. EL_32]MBG6168728.1 putative membrane protein [Aquimarina sp. EL_43]